MLISAATRTDALPAETGLRWWQDERFAIGWKGHLYLPGETAGEPSIRRLAARLATAPLARAAAELCGVFGLFVHDRQSRTWQIACDNAGLYKIFHDRSRAGTRFLELLAAGGYRSPDVDQQAVVEFLAHGAIFGPRTFVRGVEKLAYDRVLVLDADGGPRLAAKELPPAAADDGATVVRHFADLARSLEGRRFSIDLTGGLDSRLIACLLDRQGVPFEAALSGLPGTSETLTAERVAEALGRKLILVTHQIDRLEADLPSLLEDGDGLTDFTRFHRDRQNALARLGRGVEIFAHGGGGELYRDHYVIQDFPFYGSRWIRLERYYDLRIVPVRLPPAYFTSHGNELAAAVRRDSLALLETYRRKTNNETYDSIYYYVRAPEFYGQYFSNYINMGLEVAAPLLDLRNAELAIRLSPWSRFFYGWHRRMLTEHCPKIAALPTADGHTGSSETRFLARDLTRFAQIQAGRVGRKLSERVLGKALFHKVGALVADAPGYMPALRASTHFARAVDRLKALGILAPELDPATIRNAHAGRLLTAGMLIERLDGRA